jgi:hypothetical protein
MNGLSCINLEQGSIVGSGCAKDLCGDCHDVSSVMGKNNSTSPNLPISPYVKSVATSAGCNIKRNTLSKV